MPVFEPLSHRTSLIALLSADEDSHSQIKKGGREGGRKTGWISGDESLESKLNSKAKRKKKTLMQ